ncbi:MAG TPA: methionyl-tRNA formyltransferase [Thermomicrobiales bacterium]|nr:methionyl-tRNA formyltransferase [Thermomicrobiales bacterium]
MRAVFLGSPAFAVPSLVALARHNNIEIPLVVTQPDRPAGRGRALTPPAVKTAALELGLPVYQPDTLRDDAAVQPLRDDSPDLLIVVAYGELLRRNVLELTPAGCLNVHPSLLPRYRGAAPIPAAILNGDAQTGVSIMKLVRKLDAGPIVAQFATDIGPDETTATLSDRLAELAARELPSVALAYLAGDSAPVPQDDDAATYTREWSTADALIDWSHPADQIERLVRAANPWPVAWTTDGETRLRILTARIAATGTGQPPGTVAIVNGRVVVATGAGDLHLDLVQPAGKRAMPAADWWRGTRRATAVLGTSLDRS